MAAAYKSIINQKQQQIDAYMLFMVTTPLTYTQKEKLQTEIQNLIQQKNNLLKKPYEDLLKVHSYTIEAASFINKM